MRTHNIESYQKTNDLLAVVSKLDTTVEVNEKRTLQLCVLVKWSIMQQLEIFGVFLMCKAGVSIGDLRLSMWMGLNVPQKETKK